jgi:hypothetical protein
MSDKCFNCALRHTCSLFSAMIDEAINEGKPPLVLWCDNYTKDK